jgi:HlyD family secretion protein
MTKVIFERELNHQGNHYFNVSLNLPDEFSILMAMKRVLIFLAIPLASCSSKTETTYPTVENISESVYASGIIKSQNQYQVYATVNGVINEILVTEGDLVKKGDVLMTVRNEASQLNVENAKLAAEQADLSSNSDRLKQARIATELARTKLRNDSLLLVRQRNLNAQGVGTQVELEQRELAYENAVSNYQSARLSYLDLERNLTFASNQSKTNLRISKALVKDYTIRAETDGRVYTVLKERGEIANTQSPVAVIGDANNFYIELNVDEYDIARIEVDHRVLLTMDSYKGKVFEARVEKIEPLMNEQARAFIVRAIFISRPPQLYPNLSVEANIVIRARQNALTIPRSYLVGDSLVMVRNNKTRKVQIGIMDYQKAEIVSGLKESDKIYKVIP